jgi:hypothetical protein
VYSSCSMAARAAAAGDATRLHRACSLISLPDFSTVLPVELELESLRMTRHEAAAHCDVDGARGGEGVLLGVRIAGGRDFE